MKYLSKIVMALIVSVALMACDTNSTNHIPDNSDPKIIYQDTVITIYRHKDGGTVTGYRYIYVSKTGSVTTAPYYK